MSICLQFLSHSKFSIRLTKRTDKNSIAFCFNENIVGFPSFSYVLFFNLFFASWFIDYCYCVDWYDFSHCFIYLLYVLSINSVIYIWLEVNVVRFSFWERKKYSPYISSVCWYDESWLKIKTIKCEKKVSTETQKYTKKNCAFATKCGNEYLFNLIKAPSDWTRMGMYRTTVSVFFFFSQLVSHYTRAIISFALA